MIYLRQSTASQEVQLGPYLTPADFNTPQVALTINAADIQIWKAGASVTVAKNSGGATHMTGDTFGYYVATLDATDTNTCGSGKIVTHPATSNAVEIEFCVLPQNVYDSFVAGTSQVTVADIAAEVVIEMDATSTKLTDILSGVVGMPTAIDDVLTDGSITWADQKITMLALDGGDGSGFPVGSGTQEFMKQDGTTVAVRSVRGAGARTVTLTP